MLSLWRFAVRRCPSDLITRALERDLGAACEGARDGVCRAENRQARAAARQRHLVVRACDAGAPSGTVQCCRLPGLGELNIVVSG